MVARSDKGLGRRASPTDLRAALIPVAALPVGHLPAVTNSALVVARSLRRLATAIERGAIPLEMLGLNAGRRTAIALVELADIPVVPPG